MAPPGIRNRPLSHFQIRLMKPAHPIFGRKRREKIIISAVKVVAEKPDQTEGINPDGKTQVSPGKTLTHSKKSPSKNEEVGLQQKNKRVGNPAADMPVRAENLSQKPGIQNKTKNKKQEPQKDLRNTRS